jgi:hypothetical protein
MRTTRWVERIGALSVGLAFALASALGAQQEEPLPTANLVLAGYGSASWGAQTQGDFQNDFSASISPVLLYDFGADLLFEAELEFGLSGELTTTTLEYAQLDYLGFERVVLVAGKFLLPFGVFGERIHPTWINKLPTSPLLYGHAHGGVAEGSLLPILSDAGAMFRWANPTGPKLRLDLSLYVTQGPKLIEGEGEGGEHAHAVVAGPYRGVVSAASQGNVAAASAYNIPSVGFGVSFSDNNKNKMVGGRFGLVYGGVFEAYVSGFHSRYDPGNYLDYNGLGVSVEWRRGPLELRGEGVVVQQEFETEASFERMNQPGYYVQAARRIGDFEPVVRWDQILDGKVGSEVVQPGRQVLSAGLNYWLGPTTPLKVAYEFEEDQSDRFVLQWAIGF